MKVLLLADPLSSHVIKWANSLVSKGVKIFIFGLSDYDSSQYDPRVKIEITDFSKSVKRKRDGNILKSLYLLTLPKLKNFIISVNPDIVHAHSASSYGLLGALSGFHPLFTSLWGSDIFLFPKKSFFHKNILRFTLSKSDMIFSTSKAMRKEAQNYTTKDIIVLPFGVDTNLFKPELKKNNDALTIGTVKTMDYNYGIEFLIAAFASIKQKHENKFLKLLLVGGGSMLDKLKILAKDLKIESETIFTGAVPPSEVNKYHNMIDITVFPSLNESFGVSVLEASACERPVVVTNVGGLPEVVDDEVTGLIVSPGSSQALSDAIEKLVLDPDLIEKLGKKGRQKVIREFDWEKNLTDQIEYYKNICKPERIVNNFVQS